MLPEFPAAARAEAVPLRLAEVAVPPGSVAVGSQALQPAPAELLRAEVARLD